MSKIYAYTRVSTDKQTTENQTLDLENLGGYTFDKVFADVISGSTQALERPSFKEMFDLLEEGDTVVISRIDRLGRKSLDILTTLEQFTSKKVALICMQIGNESITTSIVGKLIGTILASLAEQELAVIKERVNSGIRRAKSRGVHCGRPISTSVAEIRKYQRLNKEGVAAAELCRKFSVSKRSMAKYLKMTEEEIQEWNSRIRSQYYQKMKKLAESGANVSGMGDMINDITSDDLG